MITPIAEFKALFNPITRQLLVRYGADIIAYTFEDLDEWVCINYNNEEDSPYYLHVHFDYDKTSQLIFYQRTEDSESLNEELSSSWDSLSGGDDRIKIVYNDFDWDVQVKDFLGYIDTHNIYKEASSWSYEECKNIVETKIISF